MTKKNYNKDWTKEQAKAYINSNIEITGDGCHEWQRSLTKDGYGQFATPIRGIKGVHRLAYALANDFTFTSRDQQVMHLCDNRRCCNPDHLELGTAVENMRHAWERGSFTNAGENNPKSKIDDSIVTEMLDRFLAGETRDELAVRYGVHRSTVGNIIRGDSWCHIPRPASLNSKTKNQTLNNESVTEILLRLKSGESGYSLAQTHGVSYNTIARIRRGETWSHLPRP